MKVLIPVEGKDYYTQRNNKIDPLVSCQVTAMIQAADICGYNPESLKGKFSQPEDALRDLILKAGKNPEEHSVLSLFTNKFLNYPATSFSTEVPIKTIVEDLQQGLPVVVSGDFPYIFKSGKMGTLGHVVTLIGVTFYSSDSISAAVILDSFGDFHQNFRGSGFKVEMSKKEFYSYLKPVNNTAVKWAHRWVRRS